MTGNLKRFMLGFAAVAALSAVPAAAETLRVGMECTYAPFNYKTADGQLEGYDVDVAKGVAEIIGAEIEYVCQEWDGMIPALLANKFDLIVASMSITDKRLEQMDFSTPYRVSIGRLVGPVGKGWELFDAEGKPIAANFAGLKVGVERASTYASWFEATLPEAEVVLYDGNDPMYLDLKNGRVDMIITNPMKAHLSFLTGEGAGKYEFVSPAITEDKFFGPGVGIGLRKDQPELKARLDGAIKQLVQTGKLEEYALKIFPFPIHNEAWGE